MKIQPVISPKDLEYLLRSGSDVVLIDARPDLASYQAGHLAGARHADLNSDLSSASDPDADPAHGGRHPLPHIARWLHRLGTWGIGPDTYVVTYDDQSGANAAARAWWMLRSVGHARVSVLDGGFSNAVAAGLQVTAEVPEVKPRDSYPALGWTHVTDIDGVDALRNQDDWIVLDVRSGERFRGETEPIDPVAGHIPGARNFPFAENLEGGLFKSPEALREQYSRFLDGVSPDHVVVHCGSGVTACHTLLALDRAGLEGASLFVGSWSEWCRSRLGPELKIEN
ncbi:MAG TPA: sulfurtransferase [Thermoanaerobaculia bacterium]|nr:sulfurtransferase [Thermoanaerobaculia bacterium]